MRALFPSVVLASVMTAGCSAAGVPISEPEHVEPLSTAVPLSELEAIAWSIRDVLNLAVPSLLRAPPGPITEQLTSAGTMTIQGTASQPGAAAETFTLTVAYDGYQPKVTAEVPYADWLLTSASTGPAALTIEFTDEPTDGGNGLGFIGGSFTGTIAVARAESTDPGANVDARLTLVGQLKVDGKGKVFWQVLHISGVIYSRTSGYYYNDATFPDGRN